ncbi:152_t:CDS:2 [Paraglomus brasilianum]|uniref:152_t:CDS:1 n=1 Tax=Paraglomus brasilianum TaxID=144538 RepID=A0A9N9GIF3_9GLOM|nr:152_t:CDS:2 [Paraglomus brasilianum]
MSSITSAIPVDKRGGPWIDPPYTPKRGGPWIGPPYTPLPDSYPIAERGA